MKTQGLKPSSENIAYSADVIAKGGLVVFPTETVYGLGANGLDPIAIEKIYQAKGRPPDNPMIFHISSPLDLEFLAQVITRDMEALIVAFWPGPLTLVVRKSSAVPFVATGGLTTVAVRMPDHEVALELIEKAQCPVVAPSANLSGRPSPTRYQDVWEDMDGLVDVILEGDDCQVGIESTVVDMTVPEKITVLRPGAVSVEEIKGALESYGIKDTQVIWDQEKPDVQKNPDNQESPHNQESPKSPGMKYKHYAPKGEMVIVQGERQKVKDKIESLKLEAEGQKNDQGNIKKVAVLFLEDIAPKEAAYQLFARLRELDRQGVDLILAASIIKEEEDGGMGHAVMNRMLKAAGHRLIKV